MTADVYEEAPPDPAATIESLRSLGYTPGSAVADLIDNSIAAGASTVTIVAHWEGEESWVAIIDNGSGMTEERLRVAMRIGSDDPVSVRDEGDLGRFGFGLKTASFSQARELSVATKTVRAKHWSARSWDLDHVRSMGKWMLRRALPPASALIIDRLQLGSHGTVVLWRKLTSVVGSVEAPEAELKKQFHRHLEEISAHLSMVFTRFLSSGGLSIAVGRHKIRAWDPFLAMHAATQELPVEEVKFHGHVVTVRPYVLPHMTKLSNKQFEDAAGPAGWNEQQGFYVFRKDRLITAGDWLGLRLSRDDVHNLARIAVDVPAELDNAWHLDISKATVRPPSGLRDELLRIARVTRSKAAAVHRHRGTPVKRQPRGGVEQLWVQQARQGRTRLVINRKHPLVNHVLTEVPRDVRGGISDLLAVLEETVPALLLPPGVIDDVPLETLLPDEIARLAEVAYEEFLKSGLSRSEARQRLMNTDPFHHYPQIAERFGGQK